jgi:DNA-binding beta-propeller fold protein YncE
MPRLGRSPNNAPARALIFAIALLIAACGPTTSKTPTPTPGAWQKLLTVEGEVTGVAVDGEGHIYVAEVNNDRIEKFGRDGKRLARWGQTGSGLGQLSRPAKLAVDSSGNVYVTEPRADNSGNDRVQKFSPDGVALAAWGTHGSGPGQFDHPVGIALDSKGNIYVAEMGNNRVQKLSPQGQPLAQFGRTGKELGEFNGPYGIAVDAGGNIYVTDVLNSRIQKLSPSGQPVAQWGRAGSGPGEFIGLRGLAVDDHGFVYVVDSGNRRIQKLDLNGNFVAEWAGPSQPDLCCIGGHTDLALDAQQALYASVVFSVVKKI